MSRSEEGLECCDTDEALCKLLHKKLLNGMEKINTVKMFKIKFYAKLMNKFGRKKLNRGDNLSLSYVSFEAFFSFPGLLQDKKIEYPLWVSEKNKI